MSAAPGGHVSRHCDLHLHTLHSDGISTPEEVVERAVSRQFDAIAITDHDTLAGVEAASRAASACGLQLLSGVEISTHFGEREVHVIALGVSLACAPLQERLAWLRAERAGRSAEILQRLARLGYALPPLALDNPGRMHIARALQEAGVTRTVQEAFDRFLNPGLPAFVPKATMDLADALALIREAGGLSFIAHPGLSQRLRSLVGDLLKLPFDGIEAYHVSHNNASTSRFLRLARDRGLLVSGGSDCHGGAKGQVEMGRIRVPWMHFERILARLGAQSV